MASLSASTAASDADALAWTSDITAHTMDVAHGAVGIDTDRVVYTLSLTLAQALPATAATPPHTSFLCLTWPLGGLWRITHVAHDRRDVTCESWRRTTMTRADLARERDEHERKLAAGDDVGTLFEWKLVRGTWGRDPHHWVLRSLELPLPGQSRALVATLFVGFAPLEAELEVNAITSVDTVAQTFNADVTWQVTVPAITAIREDSVLTELLDVLEFDADAFEFTNINAMQDERPLATSVTPAGDAIFLNLPTTTETNETATTTTEAVYHLQYSRRVVATFSEEMTLHNFPFDQQKLTFDFSSGANGLPAGATLRLTPTPVCPGRFAVAHFRLGNVFHVVCHDKVFVSGVHDSGPRKAVSFELLLQRKSGYYLTNVALIAACITYLSFVTYAPAAIDSDALMDTGARLQIVLTLLLTAVTFKNQVASLLPQVSYFTTLDKYVFFCFLVTCAVTIENALFPLWAQLMGVNSVGGSGWKENSLLGLSCGAFTFVNAAWSLYLKHWLNRRRAALDAVLETHELIRVVTAHFPAGARDRMLHELLAARKYNDATRPQILVTTDGDLHVQLPSDAPLTQGRAFHKTLHAIEGHKQRALTELSAMRTIYARLHPSDSTATVANVPVHTTATGGHSHAKGDAAQWTSETALRVEPPFHRHRHEDASTGTTTTRTTTTTRHAI